MNSKKANRLDIKRAAIMDSSNIMGITGIVNDMCNMCEMDYNRHIIVYWCDMMLVGSAANGIVVAVDSSIKTEIMIYYPNLSIFN